MKQTGLFNCQLLWKSLLILFLYSCTIEKEFELKSNKTSNFRMNITLPPECLELMKSYKVLDTLKHPKGWISVYEDKKSKDPDIDDLPKDSIDFLKRMFVRYNRNHEGQLNGYELKVNSLTQEQTKYYFSAIANILDENRNKSTGNELNKLPFIWDGKTLTIHMKEMYSDDFVNSISDNSTSNTKNNESELKAYKTAKEKYNIKDFEIIDRIILEKKISTVKGKHDFVKKIDDHTIEIRMKYFEYLENESLGKRLTNNDSMIVVKTR